MRNPYKPLTWMLTTSLWLTKIFKSKTQFPLAIYRNSTVGVKIIPQPQWWYLVMGIKFAQILFPTGISVPWNHPPMPTLLYPKPKKHCLSQPADFIYNHCKVNKPNAAGLDKAKWNPIFHWKPTWTLLEAELSQEVSNLSYFHPRRVSYSYIQSSILSHHFL